MFSVGSAQNATTGTKSGSGVTTKTHRGGAASEATGREDGQDGRQ